MAIKKCDCEHKYQDKLYGKYNRVHNKMSDNNNKGDWRCTVCGKVK